MPWERQEVYSELHTPHKHGMAARGRHALRHLETWGGLAVRAPVRKWPLRVGEQDKTPRGGSRAKTRPLPQPPGGSRAAEGAAPTRRPRAGSAPPAPGPRGRPRGGAEGRGRPGPEGAWGPPLPPLLRPRPRKRGAQGPRPSNPLLAPRPLKAEVGTRGTSF